MYLIAIDYCHFYDYKSRAIIMMSSRKIPKQPLKIFNPMMGASLATVEINDGDREAMEDKSTQQEYKGQAWTN